MGRREEHHIVVWTRGGQNIPARWTEQIVRGAHRGGKGSKRKNPYPRAFVRPFRDGSPATTADIRPPPPRTMAHGNVVSSSPPGRRNRPPKRKPETFRARGGGVIESDDRLRRPSRGDTDDPRGRDARSARMPSSRDCRERRTTLPISLATTVRSGAVAGHNAEGFLYLSQKVRITFNRCFEKLLIT